MIDEQMIQTEEYILQEEKERLLWEEQYGEKKDRAIELANIALLRKNQAHIKELEDYFKDENMVKALSEESDIAFIMVMLDIYSAEKNAKIENVIFNWGDNLDQIIIIIRQIKFLLWEMEFLRSNDAAEELVCFLQEKNISMQALEYIIFISSYDKAKVVGVLERIL